jgi:uncharacterized membrane protein
MSTLLRLLPIAAGFASSQARSRLRDAKINLMVSATLAVGAATAYACIVFAIVTMLIRPLGLPGAFLATGAGAFSLALILAFVSKIYRKISKRNRGKQNESMVNLASTSLALVPLLARQYTRSNPKLALTAAATFGLALAAMTSDKSHK